MTYQLPAPLNPLKGKSARGYAPSGVRVRGKAANQS